MCGTVLVPARSKQSAERIHAQRVTQGLPRGESLWRWMPSSWHVRGRWARTTPRCTHLWLNFGRGSLSPYFVVSFHPGYLTSTVLRCQAPPRRKARAADSKSTGPEEQLERIFRKFDADEDGMLSPEELEQFYDSSCQFALYDTNKVTACQLHGYAQSHTKNWRQYTGEAKDRNCTYTARIDVSRSVRSPAGVCAPPPHTLELKQHSSAAYGANLKPTLANAQSAAHSTLCTELLGGWR